MHCQQRGSRQCQRKGLCIGLSHRQHSNCGRQLLSMSSQFPRRSEVIRDICLLLGLPDTNNHKYRGVPGSFFTSIASEMGINTLQSGIDTAKTIIANAHLPWMTEFIESAQSQSEDSGISILGLLQVKNAVLVWQGHQPTPLPKLPTKDFFPWKPNPSWKQIRDSLERESIMVLKRHDADKFRSMVLDIYGNRCAISGYSSVASIDVAHIVPYHGSESDVIQNAIPLRADLHRLFDNGLIRIEKIPNGIEYQVLVHQIARTDYIQFHKTNLLVPEGQQNQPSEEALKIQMGLFSDKWS